MKTKNWVQGALAFGVVLASFSASTSAQAVVKVVEGWKGEPLPQKISAGAMIGLGIVDSTAGFAILATGGYRILDHGFIPDINNQVFIEGVFGPIIASRGTAWAYGVHMRWDFVKDEFWTLYALGGVGGNATSAGPQFGGRWTLHPRIAAGALWSPFEHFSFRGEVGHEWIAAGVNFGF